MKRSAKTAVCLLALAAAGPGASRAAAGKKEWRQSALGRTRIGEVWMGKKVDIDLLRGKVVLLDIWGYDHKPSEKLLSYMVQLHKQYAAHGLVIIGVHADQAKQAEAVKVARENGVTYTIVAGVLVPDLEVNTYPHSILFAPDGSLAWNGSAKGSKTKLEAGIRALLKHVRTQEDFEREARIEKILGGREYKRLSETVRQIKMGRLGVAYKQCQFMQKKPGDAGAEATALLAGLDAAAADMFDRVDKNRTESPAATVKVLKDIQKMFGGTDHYKAATDLLKQLAGDKEFQAELKAEKEYLIITGGAAKLPPRPTTLMELEAWKSKYASPIRQIKRRIELFRKKFPDSRFVGKLDQVALRLE